MSADDRLGSGADFGPENGAGDRGETLPGAGPATGGQDPDHGRLRTLSAEISRQFPLQLDHTALVLYDLDPEHLQVQWSVAPEDLASARGAFSGEPADVRQVLRLCRLDGEGRTEVVDRVVTVAGGSTLQGHRRFAPEQLGAEYECELGLESGDGGWLMLVRSNRIQLAGRNLLPHGTGRKVGQSQAGTPECGGSADPGKPGHHPVEPALAADGEPLFPVFPSPGAAHETPAVRLSPTSAWPGEGSPKDRGPLVPPKAGERPEPGRGSVPSALPADDSAVMPPPLLPSTRHLAQSATDTSLPRYDPRAALSSAALRGSVRERAELEVQAELVVQGCTHPGALVELFGLAIRVGEDGRFSIRYPVADPWVLSLALGGHPATRHGDPEQEKPEKL